MDVLQQIVSNTQPGPLYSADLGGSPIVANPIVRLIAFFLPQFHPIPENDAWWGKGFTEWTNVTKAVPRFPGHYQPRLPGELGFYDLRAPETLQRQAALAKRYGVHGFCFHHYWFNGHRLLEQPLNVLLDHPEIDIPFCINWANENWSRRWDGREQDTLIAQQHSPEDDIAFATSLEPLFRDPRYIRIDGRPLLILYRPELLPDAAATVQRWREHFVREGLGDPYIMMVQCFGDNNPNKYGMDAAVGFPPHNGGWDGARIGGDFSFFDKDYQGNVFDYSEMALRSLRNMTDEFKFFPGVCPAWDNEARKPGKGFCFAGSTPQKYARWLEAACRSVMDRERTDERLVFVNAWNEWAEGAYLEPDRHFGYAYLAETAKVLNNISLPPSEVATRNQSAGAIDPASSGKALHKTEKLGRFLRKFTRKGAYFADGIARKLRSW